MSGNEIFWQSGTWMLFAGQALVLVLVVALYFTWGKGKEAEKRVG